MLVTITTGGDQASWRGPSRGDERGKTARLASCSGCACQNETAPRPAASRRHIVKAAEAFLRARLPDPVAIRHLCGVTGVCERTLRNAFYDVLGMSPRQFMLRARLDQVHEALKRRDKQVTVTAVATRSASMNWGGSPAGTRSSSASILPTLFGLETTMPSLASRCPDARRWRPNQSNAKDTYIKRPSR